jgi:hypothetical protein
MSHMELQNRLHSHWFLQLERIINKDKERKLPAESIQFEVPYSSLQAEKKQTVLIRYSPVD